MRKSFKVKFINVATPNQSTTIIKNLVRGELQKVFQQHGVIATNLDEVLDKYITPLDSDKR